MWLNRALEDSLFSIEKEKIIADLELEKKQTDIFRLENKNLEQQIDLERKTSQRNIFLFTGIGIIGFLLFLFLYFRQKAVKNRIIAEQRIKQLEEEKKVLQAKALVEGQDEERKRIAQELHDGLGVMLSTVKMQFTTLKDKSPENQPLIDRASQLLDQASGDVRRISHNMMPGLLTKMGLCEAVQELCDKITETKDMEVAVEVPDGDERIAENKEIMLFRIIQEMVNNSLKHAEAKKLSVRIRMLPEKLEVFYSDDGKGFNVKEKLELKTIGLQSIHSRVNFLNGKLSIDSEPGRGTDYLIEIPLE
jgi:signal transduction histidine kinase